MVEGAGKQGGSRQDGRHQNYLFYADDIMIAPSDLGWLHGAFRTMLGLFYRVGIKTNVGNTVEMICRSCQAAGTRLEAAYD